MHVISVANQKGGVGKTTSVHNIGSALAKFHKKKTLMIDLDPQANLTDSCGVNPASLGLSVYEVMDGKEAASAVISLEKGLDLLPANDNLVAAELQFSKKIGRENLLKKAIRSLSGSGYDFMVVDCPPALGLLTVNAFVASDYILVPIQAEYHALAGLASLTQTLAEIRDNELNSRLEVLGVFVTFFDGRKNLNVDVAREVKEKWGETLMNAMIRDNVSLAEAPSYSKNIFAYKQKSFGSADYKALGAEIIKIIKKR